jgi:hypothetical protein
MVRDGVDKLKASYNHALMAVHAVWYFWRQANEQCDGISMSSSSSSSSTTHETEQQQQQQQQPLEVPSVLLQLAVPWALLQLQLLLLVDTAQHKLCLMNTMQHMHSVLNYTGGLDPANSVLVEPVLQLVVPHVAEVVKSGISRDSPASSSSSSNIKSTASNSSNNSSSSPSEGGHLEGLRRTSHGVLLLLTYGEDVVMLVCMSSCLFCIASPSVLLTSLVTCT